MEERWAMVLPANPYTWRIIKEVEKVARECGVSMPELFTLENRFGDVIAFVIDTANMDEFEEASIMQAMPYCDKRVVPHVR